MRFTGADFFTDKNVCGIAIEAPNAALGSRAIGLWARTLVRGAGGWAQAERGARPQQGVFLPGPEAQAYAAGEPVNDARFVAVFAHGLEHAGGYAPDEAVRVARTLLPDVMVYDPTRPASFPSNGRALTDDGAAVFMAILTNGKAGGHKIRPHSDLLTDFPYLGPPHNA